MEKKLVVEGIYFNYKGPFELQKVYEAIEDWATKYEYQREIKRKGEEVHQNHKRFEYYVELQKKMTPVAIQVIRVRLLCDKIVDVSLQRGKAKKPMQSGEVLVQIDGFLETDMEKKWHQQPEFFFVRTLFDRFIYSFHHNRHEKELTEESRMLLNELRNMFQRYAQ